jgi:hypothetical protein
MYASQSIGSVALLSTNVDPISSVEVKDSGNWIAIVTSGLYDYLRYHFPYGGGVCCDSLR